VALVGARYSKDIQILEIKGVVALLEREVDKLAAKSHGRRKQAGTEPRLTRFSKGADRQWPEWSPR
jgi:hypothetical protein